MNDFCKLLSKPAAARRHLNDADVQTLADVCLKDEPWSPSKALRALELMQLALRCSLRRGRTANSFDSALSTLIDAERTIDALLQSETISPVRVAAQTKLASIRKTISEMRAAALDKE